MKQLFLILAGLTILVQSSVDLPAPPGPCNVQATSTELIDDTRLDPYSHDGQHRALMVTSYIPLQCNTTRKASHYEYYIPSSLVQGANTLLSSIGFSNGSIDSLRTKVADSKNSSFVKPEKAEYPVVLFSHGLGGTRFIHTQALQAVASHGVVVISIDHPHDAIAVEFPDGHVILGTNINITNPAETARGLDTRVQDVIFTLNQLPSNPDLVPPTFAKLLNLKDVTVAGHSFGGATAALTMHNDTRFVGGMNFDGSLFGSVVNDGLDRPFITFGKVVPGKVVPEQDESWQKFWDHSTGYKPLFALKGAQHLAFTDLPLVRDSLPGRPGNTSAITAALGTVPGLRVRDIIADYIVAGVKYFTSGEKSPLLLEGSEKYPEVELVQ